MASSISRSVCRSWRSAISEISRKSGVSPSFVQSRAFSDLPPSTPDSSEEQQKDEASLDSPAITTASDDPPPASAPSAAPAPAAPAGETKNYYPPRISRAPRGVYKAIILGEVGNRPIQKVLKSGRSVTIFAVGTGGMYNNRRPFEGESAEEFAERSYTQWHRVSVYQDRLAGMVMDNVKTGTQVYLEGNIESRIYNDPNSGTVKRIREIAIRANGRLMFMDAPLVASPTAGEALKPAVVNVSGSA